MIRNPYNDKIIVDRAGEADEYVGKKDRRRHVRYPVCLAVRFGDDAHDPSQPDTCADFILNISKGGVFIMTDAPYPIGSKMALHFYIPPDEKTLAEFHGAVVGVNTANNDYPKGMFVKFTDATPESLSLLEDYLEERRSLVDKTA